MNHARCSASLCSVGEGFAESIKYQIHAVVNAITHIDIKSPWLPKQVFVARVTAAMPVAGRLSLGISLRFHNHAPQQLAPWLPFHKAAADEVGGNLLGGAGVEGLGEVLGGRGGYGSCCFVGRLIALLFYPAISIFFPKGRSSSPILTGTSKVTSVFISDATI